MSSKEEVAALMAHGDAETKISLLKKAVVSVTKQKQLLEQHNKQLQDQMVAIGEELAAVQEENKTLQKKLKTLENELQIERKRGYFGTSVKTTLKGLSSFMSGAEEEESNVGKKRVKGSNVTVNLSPEDQEKIVAENENLHMQLFDIKSKYEDELRNWKTEKEEHASENATLQAELTELRSLLDSTAQACDHLNVECTRQSSLAQFCYHFFALSWNPSVDIINEEKQKQQISINVSPSIKSKRGGLPPHEICEEFAIGSVKNSSSFIRTLMSGISVLIASLRDAFNTHVKDVKLSDIRSYRNRLSTLLEAHGARKTSVLFQLKEFEDVVLTTPSYGLKKVQETQSLLFDSLDEWFALMCEHTRLLVDACLTINNHITFDTTREGISNKQIFMKSTVRNVLDILAIIRASLEVLNRLCKNSLEVLTSIECDSVEWLIALERFWWEECNSSTLLRQSVGSLIKILHQLTLVPSSSSDSDSTVTTTNSPVQTTLQFLYKSLGSFAIQAWDSTDDNSNDVSLEKIKNNNNIPNSISPQLLPPHLLDISAASSSNNNNGFNLVDNREIIAALAAADRAAVCYHTQMNFTLLELAEKEDALVNLREEVKRLEFLNHQQSEDAERVREALETQIRLLSDQLVEYTNSNNSNNTNGDW